MSKEPPTPLICNVCKQPFLIRSAEYRRQLRKGRVSFSCSRSCAMVLSNIKSPRGGIYANLKGLQPKHFDEASPFRWYMRRARYRKQKGLTDLTTGYLKKLWEAQKGACPFTGWLLNLPEGSDGWSKEKPFSIYSASLDRIDNSTGYIQGNVRFISVIANYARNNFPDQAVFDFCNAVTKNHPVI